MTTAAYGSLSDALWGPTKVADAVRRAHSPERADDIIAAVERGDAQVSCYPEGFLVWQIRIRNFVPVLVVWLAYGRAVRGRDAYEDDLLALARACQCRRLAFFTARPAPWRRVLGPEWRQEGEMFQRAVPEGRG